MDLVYIHPGGVRTAMYLFFCKVSFEKHPSAHSTAHSTQMSTMGCTQHSAQHTDEEDGLRYAQMSKTVANAIQRENSN